VPSSMTDQPFPVADNTVKTLSEADKIAARLRMYIGQLAYVTTGSSNWGAMGWLIAEVNDNNILQLFTPAGNSSSRAVGVFVQCDKLHLIEVPMGSCPVQINVVERYGGQIDYGEAKSWAERGSTPASARPRGNNIFYGSYRKDGTAATRGIYIYAPTNGNPDYSLVAFDKTTNRKWVSTTVTK
jgi:hypothetical protein